MAGVAIPIMAGAGTAGHGPGWGFGWSVGWGGWYGGWWGHHHHYHPGYYPGGGHWGGGYWPRNTYTYLVVLREQAVTAILLQQSAGQVQV